MQGYCISTKADRKLRTLVVANITKRRINPKDDESVDDTIRLQFIHGLIRSARDYHSDNINLESQGNQIK